MNLYNHPVIDQTTILKTSHHLKEFGNQSSPSQMIETNQNNTEAGIQIIIIHSHQDKGHTTPIQHQIFIIQQKHWWLQNKAEVLPFAFTVDIYTGQVIVQIIPRLKIENQESKDIAFDV